MGIVLVLILILILVLVLILIFMASIQLEHDESIVGSLSLWRLSNKVDDLFR